MYQDLVQAATTTHTYVGTSLGAGANSIDGDFDTYQGDGITEAEGKPVSSTYTITSAHVFSEAFTIAKIRYKLYGHARNSYIGGHIITVRMEYTLDGTSWSTVSGTETSTTYGTGSDAISTNDTTIEVLIENCLGVRGYVYVTAWEEDGHIDAYGYIYEIQAFPSLRKSYSGVI